jgi:steroid delta-isomerase-like uncharacterized protein
MSTPEENKAVVRRHLEVAISTHSPEIWDEIMAEDFLFHNPVVAPGRAGYHAAVDTLWAGFPDLSEEIVAIIAEGDNVAVHYIERGTHTGEFAGVAPTGRMYEKAGLAFYRVQDGWLQEAWAHEDGAGFARQIFGAG